MALRAVLVRHGETENNRLGKFQGSRVDIPLNDAGVEQAEVIAAALTPGKWSKVFSSDLLRAVQTARVIAARLGVPTEEVPEFRERDLGEIDGLSREAYRKEHPEAVRTLLVDMDFAPKGGETRKEVATRFLRGVSRIFDEAAGALPVLFVTHGGVLDVIAQQLLPDRAPRELLGNGRALSLWVDEPVAGRRAMSICHFNVTPDECEGEWPKQAKSALSPSGFASV